MQGNNNVARAGLGRRTDGAECEITGGGERGLGQLEQNHVRRAAGNLAAVQSNVRGH